MERILIAINVRWWNAEAAYALNLALGLKQAGQEVILLANPDSPVAEKAITAGLEVLTDIHLDEMGLWAQRKNYLAILRLIKKRNLTVLHSFKPNGSHLFGWARKKFPGLIHVRTRGEARPPTNHFLNRRLYGPAHTDGILAAGGKVKDWLLELGLKKQLIQIGYYAMEPMPEWQGPKPNPLGLGENEKMITLLGRTQPVKGHKILLQAFDQLNWPGLHLVFLIKDLDEYPEVVESLEAYIATHHLGDRVHLVGFQKDLNPWMEATDLACIPSLGSEINCRAAVEFMSKSVPILSFPTGSLPEVIIHKKTGFVCPGYEVKNLLEGLQWCLESPSRLQDCGQKGRLKFQEKYSLKALSQQCLQFYQEARTQRGKYFA